MGRQVWLRVSILVLLVSMLQGCGFHLRGMGETNKTALPDEVGPIQVHGLTQGDFLRLQIEEQLIDNGTGVAADAAGAASQLRITGRQSDRRVLAVDSSGKALEYELRESLSFSLVDASGQSLIPPQQLSLQQNYINPGLAVLGSAQEELTLRRDMWQRLANQLIRRLAAQLR